MDCVERILSIYSLIKKKIVKEVEFIPSPAGDLTSHIFVDGHLGVTLGGVKQLFKASYSFVKSCEFGSLQNASSDFDAFCTICLLLNPNITTLWNARKNRVQLGLLAFEDELYFTAILIRKYPKCSDLFRQRDWLLFHSKLVDDEKYYHDELLVCLQAADGYSNNYGAWTYRQKCISKLPAGAFLNDLHIVRKWRELHISDYSGFHYCQFLVGKLGMRIEDLMDEYKDVLGLVHLYQGHESLWYHRRWVVLSLCEAILSVTDTTSSLLVSAKQLLAEELSEKLDVSNKPQLYRQYMAHISSRLNA